MRFRVIPITTEQLSKAEYIEAYDISTAIRQYKMKNSKSDLLLVGMADTTKIFSTLKNESIADRIKQKLSKVINLRTEVLSAEGKYLIKIYDANSLDETPIFIGVYSECNCRVNSDITEEITKECLRDYFKFNCNIAEEFVNNHFLESL